MADVERRSVAEQATPQVGRRGRIWERRLVALCCVWLFLACGSAPSPEEIRERERKEREDREKGFHCLSGWDGSHRNFERMLKNRLKDPDSYEHIETRVTRKGSDGLHTLYTKYRAKNSFGGYVVQTATGKYDVSCNVVSFDA